MIGIQGDGYLQIRFGRPHRVPRLDGSMDKRNQRVLRMRSDRCRQFTARDTREMCRCPTRIPHQFRTDQQIPHCRERMIRKRIRYFCVSDPYGFRRYERAAGTSVL